MKQKEWLDAATSRIRFRPDREAVRRELEAHLEDVKERQAAGQPEAQAEATALKAMGDPEALAEELGRLHRPWWGYLWRASQVILAGAAAAYCLVLILLAVSPVRSNLLPHRKLERFLRWEGLDAVTQDLLEKREIPSDETVKTGGYAIHASRLVLGRADKDEPLWNVYIELNIDLGWRREYLTSYAISGARINAGAATHLVQSSANWAFWQKAMIHLVNLPEEPEWVELDFGYGDLRQTMRIDLTEGAGT